MIIEKITQKKVLRDFFFIEGMVEIDQKYFIQKIKEGCNDPNNLSFKTNIHDQMTDWKYFNEDSEFLKLADKFKDLVDNKTKRPGHVLEDAWGFCVNSGGYTKFHSHSCSAWSGVIYINDHTQTLDFLDIRRKVKPVKGRFILFSSFLDHGCKVHTKPEPKYGISFNYV
jgi:hypothetical protein